ncbi:MAG: hypothetical protein WC648_04100 [Candidatus Paceibacterota bacterium]|jgi:hypothetical protein
MQIFKDGTWVTGIYYKDKEGIYIPDDCEEAEKIIKGQKINIDFEKNMVGEREGQIPIIEEKVSLSVTEKLKNQIEKINSRLEKIENSLKENIKTTLDIKNGVSNEVKK